jgi:hypothetical protein
MLERSDRKVLLEGVGMGASPIAGLRVLCSNTNAAGETRTRMVGTTRRLKGARVCQIPPQPQEARTAGARFARARALALLRRVLGYDVAGSYVGLGDPTAAQPSCELGGLSGRVLGVYSRSPVRGPYLKVLRSYSGLAASPDRASWCLSAASAPCSDSALGPPARSRDTCCAAE